MSIVDIFWKRQKRLREETPDIYEYADLPIPFRRQVIFILKDIFGDNQSPGQTSVSREFMMLWPASSRSSILLMELGTRRRASITFF